MYLKASIDPLLLPSVNELLQTEHDEQEFPIPLQEFFKHYTTYNDSPYPLQSIVGGEPVNLNKEDISEHIDFSQRGYSFYKHNLKVSNIQNLPIIKSNTYHALLDMVNKVKTSSEQKEYLKDQLYTTDFKIDLHISRQFQKPLSEHQYLNHVVIWVLDGIKTIVLGEDSITLNRGEGIYIDKGETYISLNDTDNIALVLGIPPTTTETVEIEEPDLPKYVPELLDDDQIGSLTSVLEIEPVEILPDAPVSHPVIETNVPDNGTNEGTDTDNSE